MKSLLVLLCTSLLASGGVYAAGLRDKVDECLPIGEEIIPLRIPNFDVTILWKKTMGVEGPDKPVDLISLADGGFAIVGESALYNKDKGIEPPKLYLTRIDINGKVIWEKRIDVKGFARAAAGVAVKDRLAVLSQVDTGTVKAAQIDFFDGLGALKSTVPLSNEIYNYIPKGLVVDAGSESLTAALWAVNRKNPDDNFTVLYRMKLDGTQISSRQYLPGVPNHAESFRRLAGGDLLGTGRIQVNKFNGGWIFRVSAKGDLIFQRSYSRGNQSNIRKVAEDADGNLIAVGDTIPAGEGLRAAWIMKLDKGGNPLWQKFVKGTYAFSGTDVSILPDGRIVTMVNARPVETKGGREHVRILTFSPEGRMLGDEALIEGANAQGVTLLTRPHSRIISGVTQSGLVDFALAKDQKGAGYDFWIMGLPKLSPFNNKCASGQNRDTFDEGL